LQKAENKTAMQQSASLEFLPVSRFARLAGTNRTTLKQQVERGIVTPSAWIGDRPLFAVRDLSRVIKELKTK
jgi:hypothetical protein